jgi:threonyl-tRNA synthetase
MQQLQKCLEEFGNEWSLNPGDGAFYGPKVRELREPGYHRHSEIAIVAVFCVSANGVRVLDQSSDAWF